MLVKFIVCQCVMCSYMLPQSHDTGIHTDRIVGTTLLMEKFTMVTEIT